MLEIFVIIVLFFLSAFYSGNETGIYTISRLKIRINKDKGRLLNGLLYNLLQDEYGLVFTTLCGSNLSNYLISSFVTGLFIVGGFSANKSELYATIILTPVLFLFSEALPKHIYYSKADSLMPIGGLLLWFSHKFFTFTGLIPSLKFFARLSAKLIGSREKGESLINTAQRHHMSEILRETHKEDILSPVQTKIIEQVINISNSTVGSVMVPINTVLMINSDITIVELYKELEKSKHQHRIVFSRSKQNILGYINIYEILNCGRQITSIEEFINPLSQVLADVSIMKALNIMTRANHRILLVTGTSVFGKTTIEGIVTVKDLTKKITDKI